MRYFKAGVAVFFVLAVSFFVVKSCVHPKRAPYSEKEFEVPFFSQVVKPRPIVVAPKPKPRVPAGAPRMAIILDDWGKNYGALKYALDIKRPLTLAVIPHLPKSKQIAEEAHAAGLGVMLHLPMEPKRKGEPLEPTTILTSMSDKEILKCVDDAVAAVPHLEGVNNHQGSAVTSDARVMKLILKRLKSKKLFFVDSAVVSTTQGPKVAAETGIRFAKRDVFIDNVNKLDAVKAQLAKALKIALSHGEAVVIGHDRKTTLLAIKEMVPAFDEAGVKLVLARELVRAA